MALEERAILVGVNFSMYTGRKYDGSAKQVVMDAFHTGDNDCGNFVKYTLPKKLVNRLTKTMNSIRQFHNKNTLPWSDNATRMLPTKNYFKYMEGLNKYQTEWDELIDEVVDLYPSIVANAPARLGEMFSEEDFPSAENFKSRFHMQLKFYPVPTTGDIRIDLDDVQVEKIKENIAANAKEKEDEASKELWSRMYKVTSRIVDRLQDHDKIFRDSLFTNVAELYDMVKILNVYGDPEIDTMVEKMKEEFLTVDPDTVRDDTNLRSEVHEKAKEMVGKMKDFI